MKVVLVNPFISGSNLSQLYMREPLGLAYLAGFLKSENYTASIIDCFAQGKGKVSKTGSQFRKGLTDDEFVQILGRAEPDIVGITCNFTVYSEDAYHIAKLVKDKYPDALVVLGGAHASALAPNDLREKVFIDIVVRGEGENTLLEIVRRCEQGGDPSTIKGTMFKRGRDVVVNPPRERVSNLDTLPLPARELLDMDFYLEHSDIYGHAKRQPVASLITSRGCPFDCVFCSAKNVWGRTWRGNSPERILAEIELLIKDYKAKEIFIYDDNFFVDLKRASEICDLLIQRKFDVSFAISSGIFVEFVNRQLLSKLKKAGVYRLVLPIETGNEKTLRFIRKQINLSKVKEKIKLCQRMGFWTICNFIIGFPYESEEDILETIHFAEDCGCDFVMYFVAQPFLGSDLYQIFQKEKLLPKEKINLSSRAFDAGYNTKYLSYERIQYLRDQAASRYLKKRLIRYLNPQELVLYFLPKIKTVDGLKYFLKLLRNTTFLKILLSKQKI